MAAVFYALAIKRLLDFKFKLKCQAYERLIPSSLLQKDQPWNLNSGGCWSYRFSLA